MVFGRCREFNFERLASNVATIVMAKNKRAYTPFIKDFVVVVNAEKIKVTCKKMKDKKYHSHSGYLGGVKTKTISEMLDRKPEDVIRLAVKRMLPKTILGRKILKKVKIYSGSEHPHHSQKPEKIEIKGV